MEAIGGTARDKGKNLYSLGLVARMFDLDVPKLEKLIQERFAGKDPSITTNAISEIKKKRIAKGKFSMFLVNVMCGGF